MNKSQNYRYKNAGEALKQLQTDYNDWSAMLTSHSLQVAYAVIAANWAVHGNAQNILNNFWSTWSLTFVFIFLVINLVITRLIAYLLLKQYEYAEENGQRWEKEYTASISKQIPWPYTTNMGKISKALRSIKLFFPLIAAIFFIISLFSKDIEFLFNRCAL